MTDQSRAEGVPAPSLREYLCHECSTPMTSDDQYCPACGAEEGLTYAERRVIRTSDNARLHTGPAIDLLRSMRNHMRNTGEPDANVT